ncbi:thiamine pyrophosphate-binding protein [Aliiglaciecola sp. 2_MG-2023]|uniref:thiamine pyrophosphate-dependent enzyme n=1 Tax=unclassified Aliiglaciecola TaxID=2593648 RepID=UPI0026E3B6C6|nr:MULTISPECIES: thiamine pyrophosphate-dependent enzyme [unclassified Aliiglaciecola]MDO6710636.1 thiamine pyrophosphate-binding protein [Aliiglaciecola sp. 2_MG-2023]MDO6754277.1 thiamine pyrophosphate-binding protein [Aliiglaciecola sp. 1_MG-2023]
MTKMTGAVAIIKSLKNNGVDTIFGLPGGQLDHLFDAMYHEGKDLKLIHSRHEQGAAYMAYGYAKSTGNVGVYTVVPGPGLLNSTGALCTAWGNYSPVLCISGQIPSTGIGKGYGDLHEIPDQMGMISNITKYQAHIGHPSEAPEVIEESFKQLTTGCPQPVAIEMPMDTMGLNAEVNLLTAVEHPKRAIDHAQIKDAIQMLLKSEKPMIVVGSGAIEAADEINRLAETLQIPVMACRSGKGIVPSESYLSANFPMGHRLWGEADAVLAIGTRLHWPLVMWGNDEDLNIIRVDIDPQQITRICTPEIGIVGDAKQVTAAMNDILERESFEVTSRKDELLKLKSVVDAEIKEKVGPQMAYLEVIREELPEDGIFVDEVTQVGFVSWYGFPVNKPRQHISAGYQGTLGYGYATALGVMAGNMDKRVIQISGDGGIMFNVQEIATAVQYKLPLVTIIFNDSRFTNVQRQQKEWFDNRVICSDLTNPDFVQLAESFGAAGFKANDPESMRTAIRAAFEQDGPSIIEVIIDDFFPAPWPFLMMPQNRKEVCK